jgi:hypothetical protein
VQTLFIDDIDGSAAEGTVRFGLDGTEYEIDLNAEHAQQLRDAPSGRCAGGPAGWRWSPPARPLRARGIGEHAEHH